MHVLKGCYEECLLFLWLAVNASVVVNFLVVSQFVLNTADVYLKHLQNQQTLGRNIRERETYEVNSLMSSSPLSKLSFPSTSSISLK